MVSWVAAAPDGTVYLLQRGDKADPILAVGPDGTVRRSWGKGLYVMPHAIRVDPAGNVWTTDAASSHVRKFSPEGRELLDIAVGGQPTPCRNNFCGTTDVAFAANGHLFIADGYANARILEYTAEGTKVREWGTPGTGPGQFNLPHSIQIDASGVVYVADRENGRVQRFDQSGAFLGEWTGFGKTFGLKADGASMWLATQPRQQPNLSPGWLLKVDGASGRLLGWAPSAGNHGMDVTRDGHAAARPRAGPGRAAVSTGAVTIAAAEEGHRLTSGLLGAPAALENRARSALRARRRESRLSHSREGERARQPPWSDTGAGSTRRAGQAPRCRSKGARTSAGSSPSRYSMMNSASSRQVTTAPSPRPGRTRGEGARG